MHGWYYLTTWPISPKVFSSLTESVRWWKEKFIVISSPESFDFPTTYSKPIQTNPVVLLEFDALDRSELHTFMDERRWEPLNA